MTKELVLCGTLVVGVLAGVAGADESARMRALAYPCMGCHGPDGESRGDIPSLDRLSYGAMKKALEDYQQGRRTATLMDRIARGYSAEEIEALARYFGSASAAGEEPR